MSSNSIDEPPPAYLVAGTEVSAKFKGAFCEAKITRVDKNVRCKITYKHNGQQATVSDEQIRATSGQMLALNEFRTGMTVQVVKNNASNTSSSTDELDAASSSSTSTTLALLNKVIDQSAYTVIFNDGDEKILRRSFIRFKGEKHYLESETLNNAPLNNPEHFLYPIKQNNSVDNVLSPTTKTKTSPLSSSSSKRSNQAANQSDDDDSDDESKSETAKKAKKTPAKRRTISVDEQSEEQSQQQSDQNKNSDDETSSDADSDSSSSSDDFPSEVKDRFVAQLYKFMDDRGTPMNRLPTINCVDIDLHRFFIVVRRYGGYNKVSKLRNWIDVYKRLNLPNMSHSANVINLKCAYKRYLQPFEDFYRKLGSTMVDLVSRHATYNTNSAKRNTSDSQSHRSLQLFKNRVYTPNNSTQKRGLSKYKQKQAATANASPSATATGSTSSALNASETTLNELKSEVKERKESVDSNVDLIEPVKTEEIKQQASDESSVVKSPELDAQAQAQACEELTLSSMVRNLNENYKKARLKEKETNSNSNTSKKYDDDSNADKETVKQEISPLSAKENSKKTSKLVKQQQQQQVSDQKILSKKKPSSSSISSSSSTASSSSSAKANENNNDDYDDDSQDDLTKPKRKVNRLSASGSDENQIILETKKKLGMKRKNSSSNNLAAVATSTTTTSTKSSNAASSSNTETNDESENDNKEGDSANDAADFKSVLSIGDLEVNNVVDVKYINGSQKRDYPAKIMQINTENQTVYVHYLGWNTRYDEWVKLDRIKRTNDDSGNPQKRRKSMKTKSTNQLTGSPLSTSSASSHLNESSSPTTNKNTSLSSISTNSKQLKSSSSSTELNVSKINERSSSTSTTSSLCVEQVKEETNETTGNTSVKNETMVKSLSDNELKPQLVFSGENNNNNSITESNHEIKMNKTEETLESTSVVITNGDSLLSIKEEIIESEQVDYPNTTTTATTSRLLTQPPLPLLPESLQPTTPTIATPTSDSKIEESTEEKPSQNLKVDTKLNNQENLKSQIKSPKEPTRQITPQPSADNLNTISSSITSLKVLNNQTNQIDETNSISQPTEDDLNKKKSNQTEETKKSEKQECIDTCKYSFNLNDTNLLGKQRIRYIEEQMKLCREVYAKLKNEIAAIDRKKKKQQKRNTLESPASSSSASTTNNHTTHNTNNNNNNSTKSSVYSNCGMISSASSTNNDDTITMTPKALKS